MKVNAITCPRCKDTIYSKALHDFRSCSCGETFIDGGFDYTRFGGKNFGALVSREIEVNATKKELYDDWSKYGHKYGLIKEEKDCKNCNYEKNKVTKVDSVDKMFEELKVERKAHPIYYFFHDIYWRFSHYNLLLRIRTFIQRGKRGWANSDTWGFGYYLAKIISEGVHHLKENINGMPENLTEGQWIDILNKITYTFESAYKMAGDELYLIKNKKRRIKWQKTLDEINKKYKCHNRCMTNKEIREYEEGWKLFKTYFFSLWD